MLPVCRFKLEHVEREVVVERGVHLVGISLARAVGQSVDVLIMDDALLLASLLFGCLGLLVSLLLGLQRPRLFVTRRTTEQTGVGSSADTAVVGLVGFRFNILQVVAGAVAKSLISVMCLSIAGAGIRSIQGPSERATDWIGYRKLRA